MAPTWCVQWDSRKGSQSAAAYWEKTPWTGQATSLGGPRRNFLRTCSTHKQAGAICAGCVVHCHEGEKRELQDLTPRWDSSTHQQRTSCLPDVRHKETGEALWLDNCHNKTAWIDVQLATLDDVRTYHSAPAAVCPGPVSSSNHGVDQLARPGFERRFTSENVRKLCQQGQVKGAVEALEALVGIHSDVVDKHLFYSVLNECVRKKDLVLGAQVHALAVRMGFGSDTFLCNHFIRMYAGHGKLQEAMDVFTGVALPSTFMWCSIISAHAKQGQAKRAIQLYQHMRASMVKPNEYVVVAALQACAAAKDLQSGKQVHKDMVSSGMQPDMFAHNALVDMFAKCGSLEDARRVFEGLAEKDVVTWNAIIAGFAKAEGMGQEALDLYSAMVTEGTGVAPNAVTFVSLLQACANVGVVALEKGKQIHAQIEERGLEGNAFVGGSVVNMYAKCGSLRDARLVFDGLPGEKTVETWTAMIAAYAQQEGMGQEALSIYSAMLREGVAAPDRVTFVSLLQACANVGLGAVEMGKQIHAQLRERNLERDVVVGGSLVNMYAKCGSLRDARRVFDQLGGDKKNVVTWNAMIGGYAQQEGTGHEALTLYTAMHKDGGTVQPNKVTFVSLLQACANVGVSALEKGKQLHVQSKELGIDSDVVVGGSLVHMYAKCGSVKDARRVFDGLGDNKNVVTWNAMIAGYAEQEGMGWEALDVYSAMRRDDVGVAPNAVTYVCLMEACANVGVPALGEGKQLHAQIKERGLESDVIGGGSVVNMYVKCGSLKDAREVFDELGEKNVVTWSIMIAGYARQEGMGQEALNLYCAMRHEGTASANTRIYVCLLEACASVGALQQGKQLHSEIRKEGLESEVLIGNCLVRMYANCGRMEAAREVFDRLPVKDVTTWTVLLKGYAEHGQGGMAVRCFEELMEQGLQPDEVTYICLLTACSHAGLVDQGQHYFDTMADRHGVEPNDRHRTCMVDLLGRSGHLAKAEQMVLRASADDAVSWTALLSACKCYGDAELGRRCFDQLVRLEPGVSNAYVLLGSIYANAGRWDEVGRVERLRKAAGARKLAAKACIEVREEVREFTVGEAGSDGGVAAAVREMNSRVREGGGHVPHTQLVLRAGASQRAKEDALCGHAEKVALAYGLLNTPAGAPLVVTKNLRMCEDCHSSTKVVSRLEGRDIVVRDGHKVHRFRNGACSCRDRP